MDILDAVCLYGVYRELDTLSPIYILCTLGEMIPVDNEPFAMAYHSY